MNSLRWCVLLMTLGVGAGCIPAGGGGGGGDDDDGGEADSFVDPDDGIPRDMFVDPDDGIPQDMFVDPDDGIPQDMFVDPDDGIPPVDGGCQPSDETCNGADDDCDGIADEDFAGLDEPCFIGVGMCEAEGVVICTPDGLGTVCGTQGAAPVAEFCNGFDDDCDGVVDEVDAVACESGSAGRCADGLEQCIDGEAICVPQLDPRAEQCNGEDDDCDGLTDEGLDGGPCLSGLPGACADGSLVCDGGESICVASEPGEELCGGPDEDCDGALDEGGVCDDCLDIECPPGFGCVGGECVEQDPCAGVQCPPNNVCELGACVPVDPGDATPIAALGGTIELAGDLSADDPVWQRMGQNCAGRNNGAYPYDALRVINLTGAPRTITATAAWGGVDGFLHVFDASFDPAVDAGCLGGNDDFGGTGASQVPGVPIAPGQTLVIVPSTYSAGGRIPGYSIEVETLAGEPGALVCQPGVDGDANGRLDCDELGCAGEPGCAPVGDELIPGVQQAVPDAQWQARGWQICYASPFSVSGDDVDALLDGCAGGQLMLACRPVGADSLTLAAEAERADVIFDVGGGVGVSHNANDVEWYLSPTRSWGFAAGGEPVDLNSCDTGATRPELRMCVHLDPGGAQGVMGRGYRCGNTFLNNNPAWERLVLTR